MNIFLQIDLNIFSLALCLGMFVAGFRVMERRMIQNRLFNSLIITTSLMLVLECLSWMVDGQPGSWNCFAGYAVETAIYVLTPIPSMLWMLYVSFQLFHDVKRLKKILLILTVPFTVNTLLALSTPITGLMFTISSNVYQRGAFFWVMSVTSYLPIIYSLISCIINHRRTSSHLFLPLVLFAVPPVIGSVLQIVFYGVTLIWSSITLSLYIVFASIQNHQFSLDHLTGVYARHPLDNYLIDRIHAARTGRRFSCIMLDIDNFKSINDRFGHVEGDEALKLAAQILKACIRSGDFLARYAGDEFLIVLDTDNPEVPVQMVERIRQHTDAFNRVSDKPYSISFSAGYTAYDSSLSREDFISHVDALMYQDKYSRKAAQSSDNGTLKAAMV